MFPEYGDGWVGGQVVPGGADLPVVRPDGIEVVDAFYRLKGEDGTTIILRNKGLVYPPNEYRGGQDMFRLVPTFLAPAKGRWSWLNSYVFVANLVDVPADLARAGKGQNDRMIQVYCVV